ncbi:glycosyltransferase [Pseudorhodoferax sp.]|uniref:glycosyltransferase n=1 Tax=Pseudorhodoferax sp. TaxID=1993553 RepID=UPI0039E62249
MMTNSLSISRSMFNVLTRGKLSILLFHAVPKSTSELVNDLTLAEFERIVDFVGRQFNVMPLDDAVQRLAENRLPERAAAITFDDGYDSWLQGVAPLLLKRNLHATFFITTAQFDQERMWHERVALALAQLPGPTFDLPGFGLPQLDLSSLALRRRALQLIEQLLKYQRLEVRDSLLQRLERCAGTVQQQLPSFTADQVRALHTMGFGIGAHTVRHPILALCDRAEAQREIGEVREILAHQIGAPVRAFAYPNGRPGVDFVREHIDMVRAAGYAYAVTTESGAADIHTPRFEIPRFTPWGPSGMRMGLQLARNLRKRPRYVSLPRTQHPAADTDPGQRPLVTFVENGSGFGGAVVALQTLLRSSEQTGYRYEVISNLPSGDFERLPAVCAHRVIADRWVNFRPLSQRVRQQLGQGLVARSTLFLLGRLDDLCNRLPYFLRLAAHVARHRPAIIHGNNDPSSNREAMLVARLLGIPYVQHVRGAISDSLERRYMRNGPDLFVPVSRWLTGELLLAGVHAERIRHIYDGVETSNPGTAAPSDLRAELGLAPDTILVAMVGMLVRWKGQDLFLDAVARLRQGPRPVAFLLIGGTPERGDSGYAQGLQQQVQVLGLQRIVHFLGKRNGLPALLPQIQICVSASTEPEPLGLVMLEALMQGCLFIGPAFGAACEVVEDGRTGYLFQPGSAASLAAKLALAINRCDDASTAAQGRSLVETWFSGPRCAQHTQQLHEQLLHLRPHGPAE